MSLAEKILKRNTAKKPGWLNSLEASERKEVLKIAKAIKENDLCAIDIARDLKAELNAGVSARTIRDALRQLGKNA